MKDVMFDGGRFVNKDETRVGDAMSTYTGKKFYPADPRPEDVDIIDIAVATGNMCRYGGHCLFYSVAEHSIHVSKIVPPELALSGLLHDATEAYIADLIRPLKRTLGKENFYFEIEDRIWRRAIAPAFGLPQDLPQQVIDADTAMLALEKEALHSRSDPWDLPFPPPKNVTIQCYSAEDASYRFLYRYCEILGLEQTPLIHRLVDLKFTDRTSVTHSHSMTL